MTGRTLGVWLLLVWTTVATAAAAGREPSRRILQRRIEPVITRPDLASAVWGIEVRSLRTGNVLYAHNATQAFVPASVTKLFTTAAALDAFGSRARVRTTVESPARVDGLGRVLGDVFLVGRGDPSLAGRFSEKPSTEVFEALADGLLQAGVRRIEGRLVGDESFFHGPRRGQDWSWDDLVWWYGAEVSALSFHDNSVRLDVFPGEAVGDPLRVEREPWSRYYSLTTRALTSAPGTSRKGLTLERSLGGNVLQLSGSYPLDAPVRTLYVALENPAAYAVAVFEDVLRSRGIRVTEGLATTAEARPRGRVLAVHEGPSLAERVAHINKDSHNLHAEMLLRRLGVLVEIQGDEPGDDPDDDPEAEREPDSAEKGLAVVVAFLERAGIAVDGLELRDGSGLSAAGQVTPRQVALLLRFMDRHPEAEAFRASLPRAGVDGSLEERLAGPRTRGRLSAKTGTLMHTAALAGYVTTSSGARLAFAILLNRHTLKYRQARAAVDAVVTALVH